MHKIRTYQVGSERKRGEGLRIGMMRYWPRGVKKEDAAEKHLDVWFPLLAPSRGLIQWYRADPTASGGNSSPRGTNEKCKGLTAARRSSCWPGWQSERPSALAVHARTNHTAIALSCAS
jgi:hypothetical protein